MAPCGRAAARAALLVAALARAAAAVGPSCGQDEVCSPLDVEAVEEAAMDALRMELLQARGTLLPAGSPATQAAPQSGLGLAGRARAERPGARRAERRARTTRRPARPGGAFALLARARSARPSMVFAFRRRGTNINSTEEQPDPDEGWLDRPTFDDLDTDSDGMFNINSLKVWALTKGGFTEEWWEEHIDDATSWIEAKDTNGDGFVSFHEFVTVPVIVDPETDIEDPVEVDPTFDDFDTDGDGKINITDIKAWVLTKGGFTEEEWEDNIDKVTSWFEGADTNGDGFLTSDEFEAAMDPETDDVPTFDDIDTDGDGKFNITDIKEWFLTEAGGTVEEWEELYVDDVNSWFEGADTNGDGFVSVDEYEAAMAPPRPDVREPRRLPLRHSLVLSRVLRRLRIVPPLL